LKTLGFAVLVGALCATAHAGTVTINFEDLPDVYFFASGGSNIGTYYPLLDFESNFTGLSISRFGGYADSAYPPNSGDVAIWNPVDPIAIITFSIPVEQVKFWYTSYDPLTVGAFDGTNTLLTSIIGDPNTDGTTGTSSLLTIEASGIASISISSTPGAFVIDDLTYSDAAAVPELGSGWLALSAVGLLAAARKNRL
jgi:hypothetical protein